MNVLKQQTEITWGLKLLEALEPFRDLVVLMHDNPDPDAIATGWAIHTLITECLDRQPRLVGGGAIVRAENRQLVALLKPPITQISELDITRPTGVVLVDCGLQAVNHLPFVGLLDPVAVIDHHPTSRAAPDLVAFQDIRTEAAATASIATSYLRELRLEPPARLASALLYAIRTETKGFETEHSALDRQAIRWLTQWANPSWIAEIENAPLTRGYFGDLSLALENATVYGDSAFCLLPHAEGAEVTGEFSDLLIRCEGIDRVLCAAVMDNAVVLSVRVADENEDAGQLVQTVLDGLGYGGGHAHRAGGKISNLADRDLTGTVEQELRSRWQVACGCADDPGVQLVR